MKSRIVLWVAVGIAIYVGATLYHSSIIKQYEEPATIEPDHVQMLRLQDAKARARLRIIKERAREQLAQDKAQFIEEAKIRARLQLARARARELLAKQKESLKQASSVAVPIASPDQGMVAGERKKIEMLNKQLGQTQSALQLQSSSNRVQMTVLEERIAKANELIITQRKELSDTQAERKKLLLQTGEKDVNLAILQNRIKHLEQGLEQKNLELRKNYSDLAITKKKIEKALLVEVKAKGLELLLDGLRQDLTSTQSKLAVANSRIVSLSTTNVQSTNELKKVEVDLNVTRDKLAKLETAHRQTIRLAEGYQDELTRLNSAKQDGFVHASSLEEQLDAASTRITILEMELDRAKLKASAMLEFGQENERLITPSKQQIGVLKNLLNNKQQALDQALSRIDILKGKQSSLQLMLKEREVSLAAKDSEVSVIESARNGLAAELNDLQNRLSKALDTTTKVNDLLKQALRDKGDAEGKVLVLTGKVRELEQSLKEHKVQQEATVAQALTETNNESDARLNALNDVIAGHQATIGQLNKKLQEALRKSTATPSQPLVDQAKLSRLQTQLADKERERQSLNTKVAELVNQLDQARKKLSGAGTVKSDNVSALEQKKSELLKSLASKNERIGSLEGEVKALEGQRQKAAMFEEQIAALKESISEKANKLDDANRLSTELSHKLSEAERQKASYGIKLGALGELLADVQSDKKRSSQRAVEAEKEIKALKEKFNSLERERDALITELESRQSKIEALLSSLDMNKITSEKVHENALLIKNGTDERVEALETLLHAKELAFQRLTTLTGSLINSKTELTAMKDEMEQLKVLLRAKDVAFHKLAVRLGAMATMPEPLPVSVGELTQIKSLLASKSTAFQKLAVTTAGLVGREQKARQELVRLQEKHDALLRDFSDSDNDSIPDSRDACPQTVVGALVGENGCVSDADGDGVPNDSDYCPNSSSKEVNVLGCAIEEVILLQGVSFTPGKSVLTAAAQEWLKPLYSQLKLHTAFTFEVAGHTDSVGDHNRNVLISYRRAASVRDFFTTHGLDETRFTIRGYGPDQPVGDNNTPEGRKLNRRVEMYFTQPTLEIAQ